MYQKLLHEWLSKNKVNISCAESCTGGLLSSYIVQSPECSKYFLGSIVSYSNDAKIQLLKVLPQTLEKFGAVSAEVAYEMAIGARHCFHSDYALSITGVAGPNGGTTKTPVGLVWFGISNKDLTRTWAQQFEGHRLSIMNQAAEEAIKTLYLDLLDNR